MQQLQIGVVRRAISIGNKQPSITCRTEALALNPRLLAKQAKPLPQIPSKPRRAGGEREVRKEIKLTVKLIYLVIHNTTMQKQEVIVRARKLGGSLVVSIPKKIAREKGIVEGEAIRIEVKKIKKDWFGALKGIGPFTKEDELDAHE